MSNAVENQDPLLDALRLLLLRLIGAQCHADIVNIQARYTPGTRSVPTRDHGHQALKGKEMTRSFGFAEDEARWIEAASGART